MGYDDPTKKSILITGAGRGFGLALARQFLSKNWSVFALVRKEADARRLRTIKDGLCIPIITDITDNGIHSAMAKDLEISDGIDILINNAGLPGSGASLNQTMIEEVKNLLDVHCLGALRVTKAVFPFLKQSGMIINISSRFGSITKISTGELDDVDCSYSYRIAKAAQNMFTQCLCQEFKNTGIKICAIHPGRLKTDMASTDADKTPEEAAGQLYERLNTFEHGKFYSLFEGEIGW